MNVGFSVSAGSYWERPNFGIKALIHTKRDTQTHRYTQLTVRKRS